MKYIVTLDITIEATNRDDAFDKVEVLLRQAESYCLYDAEIPDNDQLGPSEIKEA